MKPETDLVKEEMTGPKNSRVASNFLWRLFERFGAQGVTLVVSIVLARILDPEDYGTIALVTVFISILSVFVTSGVNDALIQKKDADELDFSSMFFFNIVLCLFLYALMFVSAPGIARFYRRPDLVPYIRVLSLLLVCSGVKNIQSAYVSRHMLFKRFFFATLGGTVAAAVVGIWMALKGCGVWALIVQNLVNSTLDTLILWLTVKWRPKLMFSMKRLKALLAYAWKLTASALVDTVYNRLYQLIIGKKYTDLDLAYYNKGDTFPNLLVTSINSATDSVLLPMLSAAQESRERVKEMTRRAIKLSSYVIMPVMFGFAAVAEPTIRLLLTDKWLPCVPYLRIFCVTYAFFCVHVANLNAIKALGRSDLYLKLEVVKKLVGLSVVLVSMWYGVYVMALSSLLTSVLSQLINSWPNRKLLGYGYGEQLKDMLPHLLLSGGMALAVYALGLLGLGDLPTLILQILLGAALYVVGSLLLKLDSFTYILTLIRPFLPGGRGAGEDKA